MCVRSAEKKCRLCLTDSDKNLSIFDPQFCEGIPLAMKILVCVSLTVARTDSLPKLICIRCADLINRFYEFREECMTSHMKLMQYFSFDSEKVSSASEVKDPGGEDQQTENLKQELMYTEALQETCDKDVADDNYTEELNVDKGSPDTVTVICGKFEEISDADEVIEINTAEEAAVNEQNSMMHMSDNDDLKNMDSIKSENSGNTADSTVQVDRVSDTVYILLKSVDVASKDGEMGSELRMQYKCPSCMEVCETTEALNKHICQEQETINSIHTSVDIKEETTTSLPKKERARWGEGRTYPCPTCGKRFRVPALLRNHERVHTGERPFLCSLCSRSFTQSYALRHHEQEHRGEFPYRCSQCEKGFFRPSSLEKHVRCHTGERPYMCSVCSKSFHQLSALVVHERIHTGERPYTCSICPMTFNQWANKQRHEKTHLDGKKPFVCDLCHRKFSDKEEMELHRAGHGGGRPRACQYCTKTFRKPSELRDHLRRTHTDERPYQCKLCAKAFFVSHELKQHLMVHTGERPFLCQYCERSFTQKGNLKRHIEKRHQVQEEGNLIVEEVVMEDMELAQLDSEVYLQEACVVEA